MTDQNHAVNRTLAHLIRGGMDPEEAAALMSQLRDEARASVWDDPQARTLAADAQSWHRLRTAVLLTVDDPHVWDSGDDEATVLGDWVRRLAQINQNVTVLDSETTQPIVMQFGALDRTEYELFRIAQAERPHRPCGGNGGRAHDPHLFDRAGEAYFCPGGATAAIPRQAEHTNAADE